MPGNNHLSFSANYLIQTWQELSEFLTAHPEKLTESQFENWQKYNLLLSDIFNESETSADKRFKHPEWQKTLASNFIQRSYQLLSDNIDSLSSKLQLDNNALSKKLQFYGKQYVNALSPSNFILTNPEVIAKTLETNGENLLQGFKQFRDDLERGKGELQISLADLSIFKLGENIACTKGKIVYENELIQLIQYQPLTDKSYERPLLILPPWINKYYILDLQKENSFVRWLLENGHPVFLISWVNPSEQHRHIEFADYIKKGAFPALQYIHKTLGVKSVNALGYCIGGTLLGCLLAWLKKKKTGIEIKSATFLTTLFDFSEPGELGNFADENSIHLIEEEMQRNGYLDGHIMASVFNSLRANDLIWIPFVNNYLKGEKLKPFDLLYWNADVSNIPQKAHSFYLRKMYLENQLCQPGGIKLDGIAIDLSKIRTPAYFLAAYDDHIIPWRSSFKSQFCLSGTSRFVLTGSGHVAGVVNPPHKQKYGYWINHTRQTDPDSFLLTAKHHEGSWWNDWKKWITKHAGQSIPASNYAVHLYDSLEDAPGTFVQRRLDESERAEPVN